MTKLLLVLFLVAAGISRADTNSSDQVYRLATSGDKLTDAQATALEQSLARNPGDMDDRTRLLGYYFRRQLFDEVIRQKHVQNVLWIIANHPESEIAGSPFVSLHSPLSADDYDQGRQLWAIQVAKSPTNSAVLANAANFVLVQDKDLAEQYLKQVEQLEPSNPKWPERLGFLYRLRANSLRSREPASSQEASAQALARMEQYFTMTGSATNQTHLFIEAARDAFCAGNMKKAREYADKFFAPNPAETSVNAAATHALLGQIELQEGNIDLAKAHLLAAGKMENWLQNTLELAKALLAKGEKQVVIEYLETAKTSWRGTQPSRERWLRELQETGTTDFRQDGQTPAQIQAELRAKMGPEQFAALSNRIASAARRPRLVGFGAPETPNLRWGIGLASGTDGLLKLLDASWQKHDLESLRVQATLNDRSLPALLTKAVYVSLVESDPRGSAAALEKARELALQRSVQSVAAFEEALRATEQALPRQQSKEERIRSIFERYPDNFPLREEIRNVGCELQAIVDGQLKDLSRREYFECRGNEVFHIDEAELDSEIRRLMPRFSGVIDAAKRAAEEQALTGVGNATYTLDVPYFVEHSRKRLQPRPGVHGAGMAGLEQPDNQFLQPLARLDRRARTIHFVMRPDGAEIFQKTRSLAEAAGFSVTSESLADNLPITLGPMFDANGIALQPD